MIRWIVAFVFTQAIEIPIYAFALRRWGSESARARTALVAFGASAITHPIVWFVIPRLSPYRYRTTVILAEIFAIIVEAVYLRKAAGLKHAWLWSLAANLTSVTLGFMSRAKFGWP